MSRQRVAYVSPLPPQGSGIADYSAELLPRLAAHLDLVVTEPESEGLHREGFVDPRGEIDRGHDDAGGLRSTA